MQINKDSLLRAREIILKIANGEEPYTDKPFESADFLKDPRIIRCFIFVAEVLEKSSHEIIGSQPTPQSYVITEKELSEIILPEGNIGVTAFCKAVNDIIDPYKSKKLTGVVINNKLKKLGILSEKKTEKNKITVTNHNSEEFGFVTERKIFNGREYEQVTMNDKGKSYLLKNLIDLLSVE